MQVHYEKEGGIGILYKQDAFMLWLVGVYYELEGSYGDAFLAYRASYECYEQEYAQKFESRVPGYLGEDVVRVARLAGQSDEAQIWKQKTGQSGDTVEKLADGHAEIVFLHGNGEAPSKREFAFTAPMPDGYILRITIPEFVKQSHRIAYAEISVSGPPAKTVTAEPIAAIALKNFEHQLPGIQARAIARAIIKYTATQAAKAVAGGGSDASGGRRFAGALAGIAANVASAASEAADLRAWTLLPSEIGAARLWVEPGKHSVRVTYHGGTGERIGRTDTFAVDLEAGQRTIISSRTLE
jgi:hypothetical protein